MMAPIQRNLAIFLEPVLVRYFERAASERKYGMQFSINRLDSWQAVYDATSDRSVNLLVVDASINRADPVRPKALEALKSCPEKVLPLFTDHLHSDIMMDWLPVIRAGVSDPLQIRDLETEGWITKVRERPKSKLGQQVLQRIEHQLSLIPSYLTREAITTMFIEPNSIQRVQQLVQASRVDQRSVARHCERAGLTSPAALVIAARLVHAFPLLKQGGLKMEEIAKECGWGNQESFTEHWKSLLGVPPTKVRTSVTEEEFVEQIVQYITSRQRETILSSL